MGEHYSIRYMVSIILILSGCTISRAGQGSFDGDANVKRSTDSDVNTAEDRHAPDTDRGDGAETEGDVEASPDSEPSTEAGVSGDSSGFDAEQDTNLTRDAGEYCGETLREISPDTTSIYACGRDCDVNLSILFVTETRTVTVTGGSIGLLDGCDPVSCGSSLIIDPGEYASVTPEGGCTSLTVVVE